MIPKIIHYVWIGGASKPLEVEQTLKQWHDKLPNYKIMEWNETNFPITEAPKYVTDAFAKQKWAFVSDYIRLWTLYKYGGIYLDTDVEVLRSFDGLLLNHSFIGKESPNTMCTAVIGSEPQQEWIKSLLDSYKERLFICQNGKFDETPNSVIIFKFLQMSNTENFGIKIFGQQTFSPINYYGNGRVTSETVCIHHYSATWKTTSQKGRDAAVRMVSKVVGEKIVDNFKVLVRQWRKD
jgi:mannosyltransferase OCH1-like enzyme